MDTTTMMMLASGATDTIAAAASMASATGLDLPAAGEVMTWWQAILLGLIQGLTEFLPVSSSGHLELGKSLLGVHTPDDLLFTVCVHGATVLSTIVVFWKDILKLLGGLFRFLNLFGKPNGHRADVSGLCHGEKRCAKPNEETVYIFKLVISMIPVAVVGVFFKDEVEGFFGNGVRMVGCMLLVTALLLCLAQYLGKGRHEIRYKDAFIIGIAQALAVLPGLSRSGSTIATGLLLGDRKEDVARFSFLMVLVPILGENLLSLVSGDMAASTIPASSLLLGSLAAFVSGWAACRWMIRIVSKGKLIYFAVYCALVGILAIVW